MPHLTPVIQQYDAITGAVPKDSPLPAARVNLASHGTLPLVIIEEHKVGCPRIMDDGSPENGGIEAILDPAPFFQQLPSRLPPVAPGVPIVLDFEAIWPFLATVKPQYLAALDRKGLRRDDWIIYSTRFLIATLTLIRQHYPHNPVNFFDNLWPSLPVFGPPTTILYPCFYLPTGGVLTADLLSTFIAAVASARRSYPNIPVVPFLSPSINDTAFMSPSQWESLLALCLTLKCEGFALWSSTDVGPHDRHYHLANWLLTTGRNAYDLVAAVPDVIAFNRLLSSIQA